MAVMKPHEAVLVAHPSSFFFFFYFFQQSQRGILTWEGIKRHIKATSIVQGYQNDKQSSLLCCKFTVCISLLWRHRLMHGQMNPIDVWFDALLRGEMERLIWKWKTAWGEVGKHSALDRKKYFSLSTSLSRVRLLFPWQRSWLHENCCGCGCHGNTLHYTGVKSLPACVRCVAVLAHAYVTPSWGHTQRPLHVSPWRQGNK